MQLEYTNSELHIDGVAVAAVAALAGTPTYVYSQQTLIDNWRAYDQAFSDRPHQVCYAVKANDNLSILNVLRELGSGFDIVSGGELARVLAVRANAGKVVFSGVGKKSSELDAAIAAGVACINLESVEELERIEAAAQAAGRASAVAVRVNPDVDAKTHPYISTGLKENKFGVPIADAPALYRRIASSKWLQASGIACHIGSQLTDAEPVVAAVSEVVALAEGLSDDNIALDHIDVGGGLGISYENEQPPPIAEFAQAIKAVVPRHYTIMLEPGRSIVGPAGLLLTRIEYVKQTAAKNFFIADAAMNDLLRPALYRAYHDVQSVRQSSAPPLLGDLVGPVCESGDWLARERELAVQPGDLVVLCDAGAYSFVMASNYNARPRPAEVIINNGEAKIVRARETLDDMLANERRHLPDE